MLCRALVVGLLLNTLSCSLLVDNGADQCASDFDCARFSGTVCDLRVRLCKSDPSLQASGLDANAQDDAGGTASADACSAATFENACTNAACKPFNNKVRLAHLPPDGGLTPLRPRDAGTIDGGKSDAANSDAANSDAARFDATKEEADVSIVDAEDASRTEGTADDAGKDGT